MPFLPLEWKPQEGKADCIFLTKGSPCWAPHPHRRRSADRERVPLAPSVVQAMIRVQESQSLTVTNTITPESHCDTHRAF